MYEGKSTTTAPKATTTKLVTVSTTEPNTTIHPTTSTMAETKQITTKSMSTSPATANVTSIKLHTQTSISGTIPSNVTQAAITQFTTTSTLTVTDKISLKPEQTPTV